MLLAFVNMLKVSKTDVLLHKVLFDIFQLEDFRTKIYENRAEEEVDVDISDDFRPPQCINSRRVYASQTALKYSIQQQDPTNAGATINRRHIVAPITLSFLLCLLNIRLH